MEILLKYPGKVMEISPNNLAETLTWQLDSFILSIFFLRTNHLIIR